MSRVIVHIDRLVLHGVDPTDAAALTEGLREQLGQALRSPTALATLQAQGGQARIRLNPVATSADLRTTGTRIATRLTGGEQP